MISKPKKKIAKRKTILRLRSNPKAYNIETWNVIKYYDFIDTYNLRNIDFFVKTILEKNNIFRTEESYTVLPVIDLVRILNHQRIYKELETELSTFKEKLQNLMTTYKDVMIYL